LEQPAPAASAAFTLPFCAASPIFSFAANSLHLIKALHLPLYFSITIRETLAIKNRASAQKQSHNLTGATQFSDKLWENLRDGLRMEQTET
jgi:hypothetical protein